MEMRFWLTKAIFSVLFVVDAEPSIAGVSYRDDFDFEERYAHHEICDPLYWHPLHMPEHCIKIYEKAIRKAVISTSKKKKRKQKKRLRTDIKTSVSGSESSHEKYHNSKHGRTRNKKSKKQLHDSYHNNYNVEDDAQSQYSSSSRSGFQSDTDSDRQNDYADGMNLNFNNFAESLRRVNDYGAGMDYVDHERLVYKIPSFTRRHEHDEDQHGFSIRILKKAVKKVLRSNVLGDNHLGTHSLPEAVRHSPFGKMMNALETDVQNQPSAPQIGMIPFLGLSAIYQQPISKVSENLITDVAHKYQEMMKEQLNEYSKHFPPPPEPQPSESFMPRFPTFNDFPNGTNVGKIYPGQSKDEELLDVIRQKVSIYFANKNATQRDTISTDLTK